MQVIVLGPSGVGKTYLSQTASKKLNLAYYSLDQLFDYQGIKIPFGVFKNTLDNILKQENIIVDIGAGFYKYRELPSYLHNIHIPIIHVYRDPKITVTRTPLGKDRELSEYIATDYTKNQQLFNFANLKLDITGLSKKDASSAFADLLSTIVRK